MPSVFTEFCSYWTVVKTRIEALAFCLGDVQIWLSVLFKLQWVSVKNEAGNEPPLLHLGSLYFCWPCKMQMLCRCCCIATHLQGQLAVKGYEYFTHHKMVESKALIPKPFLLAKSVQHSLWLEHSFFWLNFEVHWLLTVDIYQAPF